MAKVVITIEDIQESREDGGSFNIEVRIETIPPIKAMDLPKGTTAQRLAVGALSAIAAQSDWEIDFERSQRN